MKLAPAAIGALLASVLLLAVPAAAQDRPAPGGMPPGGMDCDQLASVPNPPISVEACKQMMAAMQPSAASGGERPGDDAMTCADITAEMKTMKGVGLTEAQRKENAAAASEYQAILAKQQAQATALGLEATAAVNAAAAADTATEIATGGVVRGKAAAATQAAYQARGEAMGKQMAEDRKPVEQRVGAATSASTQAMSQNMQSNPRFSRLVQLAIAKNCKE